MKIVNQLLVSGGVVVVFLGLVSCAGIQSKPDEPVSWSGKFTRADQQYDLYIEAPSSEERALTITTYFVPFGKSPQTKDAYLTLFRVRGDLAFSTHVRHVLEEDCPKEMRARADGIEVTDRCGGTIDFSGFYRPVAQGTVSR